VARREAFREHGKAGESPDDWNVSVKLSHLRRKSGPDFPAFGTVAAVARLNDLPQVVGRTSASRISPTSLLLHPRRMLRVGRILICVHTTNKDCLLLHHHHYHQQQRNGWRRVFNYKIRVVLTRGDNYGHKFKVPQYMTIGCGFVLPRLPTWPSTVGVRRCSDSSNGVARSWNTCCAQPITCKEVEGDQALVLKYVDTLI